MWSAEELIENGYDVSSDLLLNKETYDFLINCGEKIFITVNGANQKVSINLIKCFLQDDSYYKHLIKAINEDGIVEIVLFENGTKNAHCFYTIAELITAINKLVENKHIALNDMERQKLKFLNNSIDFNKFLDKNSNNIYKISIDGRKIAVKVIDVISVILTLELYNRFNEGKQPLINVSKEEFVFILKKYINDKHLFNKFLFKDSSISFYQNLVLFYDTEAINKILASTKNFNYKVNRNLLDDVQNKIPKNISILEQTIYLYINLLMYLRCDDEFYLLESIDKIEKHQDLTRIETIDSKNNKVNYYEFNLLFAALLSKMGINAEIEIESSFIIYRVKKYLIKSLALTPTFNCEVKSKDELFNGLILLNHNENTQEEFNAYLANISKKLYQYDFEVNIDKLSFNNSLLLYRAEATKLKIDFSKKLSILNTLMSNVNSDFRAIAYLLQIKKLLFTADELNSNISFAVINETINNQDDAIVIVTYNLTNINLYNSNCYIYYNPPKKIKILNINELRLMFFKGTLSYIKGNKDNIIGVEKKKYD